MMRSCTENNSKFYLISRIFTLKTCKDIMNIRKQAIYTDAEYKYNARKPRIGERIGGHRAIEMSEQ